MTSGAGCESEQASTKRIYRKKTDHGSKSLIHFLYDVCVCSNSYFDVVRVQLDHAITKISEHGIVFCEKNCVTMETGHVNSYSAPRARQPPFQPSLVTIVDLSYTL